MIKFFRQIRQTLISQGKVQKYLLYAIGEIALVMIGILLALQINNWNEKKKSEQRQITYLIHLQQEMNSNLNALNRVQNSLESMINSLQDFVSLGDQNLEEISDENVSDVWNNVFSLSVVTKNENGVLISIISTGGLKEITNDSIRNLLASWETKVNRVKRQEEVFNGYLDNGNEFLEKNGSFRQILDDTELNQKWGIDTLPTKQSNKFLLESSNFENILAFAIATGNTLLDNVYKRYEEQLIDLLRIIKSELE